MSNRGPDSEARAATPAEPTPPALSPGQIFVRFLRFGLLAWGGPVAQIAMIRHDLVEEEKWLSGARFNRLLAIYQVLPGPEAHELCVHIGMLAGKRLGGLLAGLGFMLPGFILIFALSWLYFRLDISQSALAPIFLGVQVGVIALIVRAVHRIGGHVLTDPWLWLIGAASAAASWAGLSFWLTLPAAGLLYMLLTRRRFVAAAGLSALTAGLAFILGGGEAAAIAGRSAALLAPGSVPALTLFLSGLKAGLLTFGGAYTVIPFLRGDAVGKGWMGDAQFLDGLALSGVLPAPLIIFSTFVGYYAGGPLGALAMTAGIFLPAFAFSLLLYERLERVIDNVTLHHFLEGVAAGVVGLIAATTVELGLIVAYRVPSLAWASAIFGLGLTMLYLWKSKLSLPAVIVTAGLIGSLVF
jgi:chromate transporter